MGGGVPLRDMSPFGFIVMDETQTPLDAYYYGCCCRVGCFRGESEVIGVTKICKDLYIASMHHPSLLYIVTFFCIPPEPSLVHVGLDQDRMSPDSELPCISR